LIASGGAAASALVLCVVRWLAATEQGAAASAAGSLLFARVAFGVTAAIGAKRVRYSRR
jgi:hypothetical protein